MLSLSNLLTPLAGEIGIGGVGGFLVGYSLKKAAKILAIIFGLCFLALQYLAYEGIISINYDSLRGYVTEFLGQSGTVQSWITDFIAHMPFGAAFVGGLYIGLQKG
jgi:uncharacterized membrane protein (Fun14 family)